MSQIEWNRPQDQTFEAGLDRGVLYPPSGEGVPWVGLINVDDGGESVISEYFLDGIAYLASVSPRDWKGALEAYTYPREFGELIGIGEIGDGLFVDSQTPDRFDLSYRTMVSSPNFDPKPQYKIHLIYSAMASLSPFTSSTTSSEGVELTTFKFDLAAVPQRIPGRRPSAHIIIDTRDINDSETQALLEGWLYGTPNTEPRMPTIVELVDLLFYGSKVTIVDNDNHDGDTTDPLDRSWTATGSNKNVQITDEAKGYFQIDNVEVVWLDEDTYEFWSTPDQDQMRLSADTDGVPYLDEQAEGPSNVGIDTDTVPYYEVGKNDASLGLDEDDTPYYEPK
jgi:hypothetical protein